MPQMSPLLWSFLFLVLSIIVLMIISNIYFMMNNMKNMNYYNFKNNTKLLNWKW